MKKHRLLALLLMGGLLLTSCDVSFWNWKRVMEGEELLISYQSETQSAAIVRWLSDQVYLLELDDNNEIASIEEIDSPDGLVTTRICSGQFTWVTFRENIYRLDNDTRLWQAQQLANASSYGGCLEFPDGTINVLGEVDQQIVLLRDIEGEIEVIPISEDYEMKSFAQDADGTIWLLTDNNGLYRLDAANQWEKWSEISGTDVYATDPNMLWILSDGSIYTLNTQERSSTPQLFDGEGAISDTISLTVIQIREGKKLLLTDNDLWIYDGDRLQKMGLPAGNCDPFFLGLEYLLDRNLLFVSTDDCGLFSLELPE